jgi:iron complex transport system ATP-binding protein
MKLGSHNLACGYDGKSVISDITLEMSTNETLCLLGPNGVGKTTFFKTLLGFLKPISGTLTVDGADLSRLSVQERARVMAYVPQAHDLPFPFSVEEVVVMGRHIYMDSFSGPSAQDRAVAADCMEEMGIGHLRHSSFTQISGGEKQLVLIARALAQEAQFLVMDEPGSNLDFGNQVKVMHQIARLKELGKGIVLTTHSPDHALLCGTQVAVFHRNAPIEAGVPHEVITNSLMYRLYGVHVHVHEMRRPRGTRVKMCVPCF